MPRLQYGHVLVVDDAAINRLLARAFLERLGWQVSEAEEAAEALAHLAQRRPEQVLLDIRMPGVDGIALCRQIRALYADGGHVRIVAYTAHALPDEVAVIRSAGFDEVLVKPVSLGDMTQVFGARAPDGA